MELTLNNNFTTLNSEALESITGGMSGWGIAALTIGCIALCWCPVLAVGAYAYGAGAVGTANLVVSVTGAAYGAIVSAH